MTCRPPLEPTLISRPSFNVLATVSRHRNHNVGHSAMLTAKGGKTGEPVLKVTTSGSANAILSAGLASHDDRSSSVCVPPQRLNSLSISAQESAPTVSGLHDMRVCACANVSANVFILYHQLAYFHKSIIARRPRLKPFVAKSARVVLISEGEMRCFTRGMQHIMHLSSVSDMFLSKLGVPIVRTNSLNGQHRVLHYSASRVWCGLYACWMKVFNRIQPTQVICMQTSKRGRGDSDIDEEGEGHVEADDRMGFSLRSVPAHGQLGLLKQRKRPAAPAGGAKARRSRAAHASAHADDYDAISGSDINPDRENADESGDF